MKLENLSWLPDGSPTVQQPPAYLYNVNRAAAYVGRSRLPDTELLPGAVHTYHETDMDKIQECSSTKSYLDECMSSNVEPVRDTDAAPDICELGDILIEMVDEKAPRRGAGTKKQGFVQRLVNIATRTLSYWKRKIATVTPAAVEFDDLTSEPKHSLAELLAMFCVESHDEAVLRRSRDGQKKPKVSPVRSVTSPGNVAQDVQRDLTKVAAMFCDESQYETVLRKARNGQYEKGQGQVNVHGDNDHRKKRMFRKIRCRSNRVMAG